LISWSLDFLISWSLDLLATNDNLPFKELINFTIYHRSF
jgi:hypothetical protein